MSSGPAITSPQGNPDLPLVLCSVGFPSCRLSFFPPAGRDEKTGSQSFLQLVRTVPWTSLRLSENNGAVLALRRAGGCLLLTISILACRFLLKLFRFILMERCLSEMPWSWWGEILLQHGTVTTGRVCFKRGGKSMNLTFSVSMGHWFLIPQNERTELKASQVLLFSHMCQWTFLRSLAICPQPSLEATAEPSSSLCPSHFQFAAITNRSVVKIFVSFGGPDAHFSWVYP